MRDEPAAAFPDTAWSVILDGRAADPAARDALVAELLGRYWQPLYLAARYGWRLTAADAEDAVQGVYADLLQRAFLDDLDPKKGRLRQYLKAALQNFLKNRHRAAKRQKRGGAAQVLSLDGADQLPGATGDAGAIFDEAWLRLVLDRATETLRGEATTQTKADALAAFEAYDLAAKRRTYAEIAVSLGLSETAVRNRLAEARQRLRALVVQEVRRYALDEQDAADELRWILG